MAGVSSQVAGNSRGPGVGTMENTGFDVYGGYVNAAYQPLTHQVLRLSVIYGDRNPVDYYAQSKLNKDGIPRIFDPYEQRGIGKLSYEMDQLGALSSELKLYTYYHGYRQLQDRQPETVTATNTVLNNTKTKTAQDIVGGGIQNVTPWSTSWGDHKFVYGMDGRAENLRSSHLLYTTTTPPDTTTVTDPFGITPNGTYDVFDLFAMTELHPHETWTVSLGGRFENTHLHANPVAADVIPNAGYTLNDLKVDKTWDSLTWNAGAVHALNPQLDLAANIATGYRAPTFSDTLSTGTPVYSSKIASVPSPNVRPEQSITYEFGPRYHSQRWNVSLTGYWNQLWDVVTAVTNGTVYIPGQGTFAAQHNNNSGHGYVRGAEFAASCRLGDGWTVFGNATYTQGWDEGNSVYYRFIPPLNGNLGLRYESPCGRWWAEVVEVMVDTLWRHAPGDQQDSGFSTDPGYGSPSASNPPLNSHYQIPGYVVTNLRGGVRVWQGAHHERVDLTLDVNNLFDTSYREAYAQQELVAPGLNVVVGAKMTF
jgi:outer membrane receptor protein involved in Fe transport